jgi:hypothetical protein
VVLFGLVVGLYFHGYARVFIIRSNMGSCESLKRSFICNVFLLRL